jgi:hypothetical protein
MDYSRIDAPLGAALAESPAKDQSNLTVFIHTHHELGEAESAELRSLGIDQDSVKKRIVTATVSPNVVDKLSHKPWIRSIKLSQKLRPLGPD